MSVWNVRLLAVAMAIAVGIGVVVDLTRGGVEAPATDVVVPAGTFRTRAAFCPPPFAPRTASQTAALAADPGAPASIRIAPEEERSTELPSGRLLMHRVTGPPIEAIAYGAHLHAAALVRGELVPGADAARCPRVVSDKWYFPAGSSSLGYDERIMIRNPFPDEAVVSVTFFTPTGKTTKANLGEVAVPAGEWTFVKVNDFILRQPVLGVSVTAQRGRVVAWRVMFAEPENRPDGVYFGLGATSPSTAWYFPEGAVGTGVEEVLTLLNPNSQEAIVSITLSTEKREIHPPKLVEVRVPPNSIKSLSLPESLSRQDQSLGAVGATVTSTNGVAVVAERTVWYATGRSGVASAIGARETSTGWLLLPAAVASTDDIVVLLNPGSERATASLVLLRQQGEAVEPEQLRNLVIRPGARRRIAIDDITGNQPVAVVVTSDQAIVAERAATSGNGDVASLVGDVMRTAP